MLKFYTLGVLIILSQLKNHESISISDSTNKQASRHNRSFRIDYENNQFLLDGEPFRYVSGSFHYFRTPKPLWRDRLRKIRAAGLNAISTYVEWSLHQPEINRWNWENDADLVGFIKMVEEEDLLLILRPGPYICAERDLGGFPYWLLNLVPIPGQLRSDNSTFYMHYVQNYLDNVFRRIHPYLRGNGGPIIMVQVENEYGSYNACDHQYMEKLVNISKGYIGDKAVLYTTDGNSLSYLKCGSIPGAYATVDFGTGADVHDSFATMRSFEPKGPLVNSEFYPGWLTHWNESLQVVSTDIIVSKLTQMLDLNASVNFYMFHGGTNFGFTSGANGGGPNAFMPQITSYDYDAPITEAGDISPKYLAIRDVIGNYLPLPNISIPQNKIKIQYGKVKLKPVLRLLGTEGRRLFGTIPVERKLPFTMESLNLPLHLLLCETQIQHEETNSTSLYAKIADRALIYLNNELIGILSRTIKQYSLSLSIPQNPYLQILVENQGHLNFGNFITDFKGISDVTIGGVKITNWICTGFQLNDVSKLKEIPDSNVYTGILHEGPMFLRGYFNISGAPHDTYLDTTGWIKGVAYINNINLGRYWPAVGPQMTLYIPSVYLREGENELMILELEYVPPSLAMVLQKNPYFI